MIYLYVKNDGVCDYTGVPFGTNASKDNNDLAISIERIDDKKGYIKGNCCLVTVRANQLKDVLFDKLSIDKITFKREAISDFATMKNKLTPECLDFLKKKYHPDFHGLQEEPEMTTQPVTYTTQQRTEDLAVNSVQPDLPLDVKIAQYYSALANSLKKQDKHVSISFAEFKSKYLGSKCKFSGKVLKDAEKFILVLDIRKVIDKDNIILVDSSIGHKLNELADKLGLSQQEIAKGFSKLVK